MFNFYERKVLPKLCNYCCGSKPIEKQRKKVVPNAKGVVLEIGMGTGLNLPHYDKNNITKIIGLDPSKESNKFAKELADKNNIDIEFLQSGAEEINLPDQSIDTILITYTLCTIPELRPSLDEIKRVMRKDGKVLFLEHGKSPDKRVRKFQNFLNPVWGKVFGGCNLNRDIPSLLIESGLKINKLNEMYIPKTPKFIGYNFWGEASNDN